LSLALLASSVAAQREQSDGDASYSRGVHAFFAGRYADAEGELSRATAMASTDPRPFYFRALCLIRLGRMDEARGNLEIGASLEAESPNRFAVGTALQRVQGGDRLLLEKYRTWAKEAALVNYRIDRARIEPRVSDTGVLRRRVVVPLDEFAGEAEPRPLSAEELKQLAVAAAARDMPTAPPQVQATTAVREADPFTDDTPEETAEVAPPTADASDAGSELETPAATEETAEAEEPAESSLPADADEDPFSDFQ
jgi:hypothetical protein